MPKCFRLSLSWYVYALLDKDAFRKKESHISVQKAHMNLRLFISIPPHISWLHASIATEINFFALKRHLGSTKIKLKIFTPIGTEGAEFLYSSILVSHSLRCIDKLNFNYKKSHLPHGKEILATSLSVPHSLVLIIDRDWYKR